MKKTIKLSFFSYHRIELALFLNPPTMSGKILFVTTGATVIFPELLKSVLNVSFISKLKVLGYSKIKIQYGKHHEGLQIFQDGIKSNRTSIIKEEEEKEDKLQYEDKDGFLIEGFPFTNDIQQEIFESSLVISHSGTGSILDSLRLNKKLIVVINENLMDNHQLEIANELFNQNCLRKSTPSLDELIENVVKIENEELSPLPKPNQHTLKELIEST
ncbi:hypothetical protein WICMUC_003488 [Wickerhamomyces mucosus]|uniref:UDP-N-acetylglucosamine transferase subunit ALG13 n=1 Tax=Wickerhamomyces mucosus TaxID=1378264 RepID=A0A9P8TCR5_9ASCO|nr:hypothetical protein WICMUC_003488 [Wickerhamomyces mucosus]